jgi:hypothetical protein
LPPLPNCETTKYGNRSSMGPIKVWICKVINSSWHLLL